MLINNPCNKQVNMATEVATARESFEPIQQHPFDHYLVSILDIGDSAENCWKLEIQDQMSGTIFTLIVDDNNAMNMITGVPNNKFNAHAMQRVIKAALVENVPSLSTNVNITSDDDLETMHLLIEQETYVSTIVFQCTLVEMVQTADAKLIAMDNAHEFRGFIGNRIVELENRVAELEGLLEGKTSQNIVMLEGHAVDLSSVILDLRQHTITCGMMQDLAQALVANDCSHLRHFNFHGIEFINGDQLSCWNFLAEAIESGCCPNLLSIDLSKINSNGNGVQSMINALASGCCPRLQCLKFSYTAMNSNMESIGQLLSSGKCPNLQSLLLRNCGITYDQIPQLANGLSVGCPSLRVLNLKGNNINCQPPQKGATLFQSLATGGCPNLEVLDLTSCQMTPHGAQPLAHALAAGCCPKLKVLNVKSNSFDAMGIQHLIALQTQFPELVVEHS